MRRVKSENRGRESKSLKQRRWSSRDSEREKRNQQFRNIERLPEVSRGLSGNLIRFEYKYTGCFYLDC